MSIPSVPAPGEETVVLIRPMVAADVSTVARLHIAGFPNFFLTFLGHAFLCELYAAILTDKTGIAFVAVDETEIDTSTPTRYTDVTCCAS